MIAGATVLEPEVLYAHSGQTLWSEHDGDPANHPVFYCHDDRARLRWRVRPARSNLCGGTWELAPRPRLDAVSYPPAQPPWAYRSAW